MSKGSIFVIDRMVNSWIGTYTFYLNGYCIHVGKCGGTDTLANRLRQHNKIANGERMHHEKNKGDSPLNRVLIHVYKYELKIEVDIEQNMDEKQAANKLLPLLDVYHMGMNKGKARERAEHNANKIIEFIESGTWKYKELIRERIYDTLYQYGGLFDQY